jgi:hypothetical protein
MGQSKWSDDSYQAKATYRAMNNIPTFAYHAAVQTGAIDAKAHPSLDPLNVKVRESCDSP